jgi:hypothetical protein
VITSTTIVNRLFGDDRCREAFDRDANILVTVFPVERAELVLRNGRLRTAGAYILLGCGKAHVGESRGVSRRIRAQLREPTKNFTRLCYVITEYKGGFSKQDVVHIQACVDAAIEDAGLVELVKAQEPWPAEATPERIAELDRKLPHIIRLLKDANCIAVMEGVLLPAAAGDDRDNGDMEIWPPGDPPEGEKIWSLEYTDIEARGYRLPDNRFVVLPGSEIRKEENASIIQKIRTRRLRLLAGDLTERMPGISNRERLKMRVVFPSKAIAAKSISGAHLRTDHWRCG